MRILITGGRGFIGSALCAYFIKKGEQVSVLTRNMNASSNLPKEIKFMDTLDPECDAFDVIINLAGEPLAKKRWNLAVKEVIFDSRVKTTQNLVDYIRLAKHRPSVLLSGSAIGFYGSSETAVFKEDSEPADSGFTHQLCAAWENAALQAAALGVRVCTLRTGIVLEKHGGALKQMLPSFRCGLGAQLGYGKQWMSWIHLNDFVHAIDFLIQHVEISGPVNLTAPVPITHHGFVKHLAQALHRPCFIKLPSALVRLIFGQMADMLLLKGQRVIPQKLEDAGFIFKFRDLHKAFKAIFLPKHTQGI